MKEREKTLSKEAKAVLDAGRKLWRQYFKGAERENLKIREKYKLGRADVGWYQVRQTLETRAREAGRAAQTGAFRDAYDTLTENLRHMVYKYGFLRK